MHSYDFQSADAAALDVGCGSGVHSNLMVQFGFKVDAFDASLNVINYARKKYSLEKNIRFIHSTTDKFNFTKRYDLVIDRLCTSQTGLRSTKDFYNKLRVNLNASAKIFWQGFCYDNSGRDFAKTYNELEGYWTNFSGGEFEKLGCTTFYHKQDVLDIFSGYDITTLEEVSAFDHINSYKRNHWQVIARCT